MLADLLRGLFMPKDPTQLPNYQGQLDDATPAALTAPDKPDPAAVQGASSLTPLSQVSPTVSSITSGLLRGAGVTPPPQASGGAPVPAAQPTAQPAAPSPVPGAPSTAPTAPGAAQPLDLGSLYKQLLTDSDNRRYMDRGMSMLAAGFAAPEDRATMVNAGMQQVGDSPSSIMQNLMAIQTAQQKQRQEAVMQASLPTIAKQLGLPIETVTALHASGKLGDVLEAKSKPNVEIFKADDGSTYSVDKNTNKKTLLAGPDKSEDWETKTDGNGNLVAIDKNDPSHTKVISKADPTYTPTVRPDGSIIGVNPKNPMDTKEIAPAMREPKWQLKTNPDGSTDAVDMNDPSHTKSISGPNEKLETEVVTDKNGGQRLIYKSGPKAGNTISTLSEPGAPTQVIQNPDGTHNIINTQTGAVIGDKIGDPKNLDPEKKQLIDSLVKNWKTIPGFTDPADPANHDEWKKRIDSIVSPSGQTIKVGSEEEPAREKALGTEVGKAQGENIKSYIDTGRVAQKYMADLTTVEDALKSGGSIYSGPAADALMKVKQGLAGMTGTNIEGLPQSELVGKMGFDMATQAAKSITTRPSQMEVLLARENVPGLFLSREGNMAMIHVFKQFRQDEINLGNMADRYATNPNAAEFKSTDGSPMAWSDVADKYYKDHPVQSPFHAGAMNQADIDYLKTREKVYPPEIGHDMDLLKKNPDADAQARYDQEYGPGSAMRVLRGGKK